MESLVSFVLWAGLVFLMMRFGCGSHIMGHGHHKSKSGDPGAEGQRGRLQPPEHVRDPVCGNRIAARNAKSTVFDGEAYFFCSRDCREVFEAAPGLYVGHEPHERPQAVEQSHV